MRLLRCEQCHFTFEQVDGEGDADCRQCGGPTVAFDLGRAAEGRPRESRDSSKTQKLPVFRPQTASDE